MQIIILAAGKGTRMNSDLPKVLVPLQGKPLVVRLLENLNPFPDNQKLIVTGFKRDLVEQVLGSRFSYATQTEQLGTANAVWAAKSRINAPDVIVLYGDMPFIKYKSLEKLQEIHEKKQAKFSMFTTKVPDFEGKFETFSNFGRIIRKDGIIQKITEVKFASELEKKITEVNPGIYMFNTEWLWENIEKIQKNSSGEYYLTDLVEIAIQQGIEIHSLGIDPLEVYGINTPEQLQTAEDLIG